MISRESLCTILLAVLLTTSLVAMPALAGASFDAQPVGERPALAQNPNFASGPPDNPGNGGPPDHAPPGTGDGSVPFDELNPTNNGPDLHADANDTIDALVSAAKLLGEIQVNNQAETNTFNETIEALNASFREHRYPDHADSRAAFDHTERAQRGIASLAAADAERGGEDALDEAGELIFEANNYSARLAVADAERAFAATAGEFRNRGQRRSAEQALENANAALARADDAVNDGSPRRGPPGDSLERRSKSRANAITHLENAWKHADRALDRIEKNTQPELDVTQGPAIERNDSVHVSVDISLVGVRPFAYETAELTTEDGETRTIDLTASSSAYADAHGTTAIELGPDLENVTVTVGTEAAHDTTRTVEETLTISVEEDDVFWEQPAPDEYNEIEVTDDASGVSVDVGGDGLSRDAITVTDRTPETDDMYRAGPMVRITNSTPIDTAEVTVPLEDDVDPDAGNLSVVTWDPHSEEPWTAVETEIDREAGTATAEVDHFSFFSVFRIDEWEDKTSDTITLDGNRTDDRVGDSTDFELIDVMFVVDESGSMSGSRIRNAREASKRFVGALTNDEQGGLVGYASGSDLKHPLTRDHDSLNETIGNLNAGGGTNTGAGLQEALDEFERNSWENRSQTIILLSDGHTNSGPNPVSVAETAADRDIEISTIGVGDGIDENELREIAATTGGDFYHVEDDDDLPETFERVAENQTEVQLQDTNGDGIPDLVAEMDLSMPTGPDGVVGEPLDLDPIALDTSGDGIRDNETVDINYRVFQENNETKLHASVTYAEHHPARIDTTGDGLTDAQQLEGWNISVTPNRSASVEYLETIADIGAKDPEEIDIDFDDLEQYFVTRNATANPLLEDTTGNGLTDAEEKEIGTDPSRQDTTGDEIDDATAHRLPKEDPTMFTVTPPEARLLDYEQGIDWPEVSAEIEITADSIDVDVDADSGTAYMEYEYQIEDPAGVAEYVLERDGLSDPVVSGDANGRTFYVNDTRVEHNREWILSTLRGSKTEILVADIHGNAKQEMIHHQGSAFSELAKQYGVQHMDAVKIIGLISGWSNGIGDAGDLILTPIQTYEELSEFGQALWNDWRLIGPVLKNIPAGVVQQQKLDNPYADLDGGDSRDVVATMIDERQFDVLDEFEQDQRYVTYAMWWYAGYATYMIAETYLTGGIARGASSVSKASKAKIGDIISNLATGPRSSVAVNGVSRVLRANSPYRQADVGTPQSAGRAFVVMTNFQRLNFDKAIALLDDGLERFIRTHGDNAGRFVKHVDDTDAIRSVFAMDQNVVSTVFRNTDDVSQQLETLRRLQQLDSGPKQVRATAKLEEFTSLVQAHGDNAIAVLNRIDDPADVQRLLADRPSVSNDLVRLHANDPSKARSVIDVYNTRHSRDFISLGNEGSIGPLIEAANRGPIDDLQLLVVRGDRTITVGQTAFQRNVIDRIDVLRSAPSLDTTLLVYNSVSKSEYFANPDGSGDRIVTDLDDIEYDEYEALDRDDFDGDELTIYVDEDGTITSAEVV